ALSMLLSVLFVRFRDVAILWTVLAQVLFYGTPILYPIEKLENHTLEKVLMLNPLTPIFQQVRHWVLEPSAPSAAQVAGGKVWLLPAAFLYIAICALGVWAFNREAPKIAEDL
ncbi:MAG: ABC transporter permease, partial [Solirubrobacterales bacterium]